MRTKLVCNRYFPDPPGIGGLPKPPLPKGGGLAKPNRGDSVAKATDLFTIHYSLFT